MAVYFDYPIHPPHDDSVNHAIAWHKTSPLLAIGSSVNEKGCISFYLDEAELVENSKVEKSTIPVSLVWHPTRKVLATGWKNGEITLWNEHDKESHDGPLFHKTQVTNMHWNGTGSRLITADEDGLVLVWKVDQKGRLQQSPMFQNDLSFPVKQMVLKISIGADIAVGLAAAARAAVSGDESALDMFDWQKSGQSKFSMSHAESIQTFIATKDGSVHFLDERGKCIKCFQVEGPVKYLLYYETRDIVVTITETLMLCQHSLQPEGNYLELSKVKLSGNPMNFQVCWAGPGLLATCCKERVGRIIDIDNDQNFVIHLSGGHSGFENTETINCLSYNQKKGVLAGGTNLSHVAIWKYNAAKVDDNPWDLQQPSEVSGNVTSIEWGGNGGLMAAHSDTSVTILSESIMNAHFNDQVAAIQVTPNHLQVEMFPSEETSDLKTDVHIKGVYCTKNNIAIWNRRKIAVYEVSETKAIVRSAGTFNSDASIVAVYEHNVYLIEAEKISIRTFQGTIKQELTFLEQEGNPCDLNICGPFLVVGTTKSILKIYDLSRREARQISITKNLKDAIPNIGTIHSLKCNCNGTKVAITSQNNFTASSLLYVWDVESDTVQSFDFSTGTGIEHLDDGLANAQEQLTSSIKGYVPQALFWDAEEPKLFVCEAAKAVPEKQMGKPSFLRKQSSLAMIQTEPPSNLIVTMFSTPDHGIIVQDHFNKDSAYSTFLGIHTPHYYFVQTSSNQSSSDDEKEERKDKMVRLTMRDFVGLENSDNAIKKAMTDFSYLSAVGNMDDAFKAIKSIKSLVFDQLRLDKLAFEEYVRAREYIEISGSVWGNMARMCVKTKRLDVAMVCLGNMGNAIAAKAVRECQKEESDLNVQVAMLAIQIGMYEEAEELYKESGRYDLLNKFYQASNQWTKAVECAESHDRIHLRTTHYQYGRYLEEQENYAEAVKHFERSETYRIEVPRMLFDDFGKLEGYISQLKDKKLFRWWAQYLESAGEMGDALRYYELSQDYHAMVRIHCFCEELDKAEKICNDTGDKAASYHLARQLDSAGNIKGAIHYFSRAKAYSNAIRLAKENYLDGELMNMALLSSQEDMLDCARYFETKSGMEDKAVVLYHKGGRPSKAIDLAFKTEQFGALQLISEDLDENADPEVLKKCAEFFIDHDQFDKAVNLLVVARRFEEALEMCLDHHIPMSEELAEKMTLPKEHPDAKYRLKILEKLGEVAFKQGSYHLATKKFTQSGNKMKAMKALLKSGDTEKIVFFAGVSRQKEIYIMAANYLQSLDWRNDPEIMKGIINFYTKGRALDSLASFYDACAQVEIDEFQNYEKAFGALSEAYKCLSKAKAKNQTEQEERLASIKTRLTIMKKFIQAQKVYQTDVEESIKTCAMLLDDPDIENAVRIGDIYSFLVQHSVSLKDYSQAYNLMADMRQRYPSLKLRNYIKASIIEQVHRALDMPVPETKNNRNNHGRGAEESDGEEVMEEVDDEIEDDDDMI